MKKKLSKYDKENIARLWQKKRGISYNELARLLGVSNQKFLHDYMVNGKKPTKRTPLGRSDREAMGIMSKDVRYNRKRKAALDKYFREAGYESLSEFLTEIYRGADPLHIR